jgi:hypothetical protein
LASFLVARGEFGLQLCVMATRTIKHQGPRGKLSRAKADRAIRLVLAESPVKAQKLTRITRRTTASGRGLITFSFALGAKKKAAKQPQQATKKAKR